jgi:SPX domain protein involved in polyphosphate accumulation
MAAFEVYRYERKYVVTEAAADAIRRFVTSYLDRDIYMAGKGPTGYRIHSLYFDTPGYALYRQTMEGHKNRYKLRIRFYDELPHSPAFLEVKRRTTETIHKLRAAVSKSAAEKLLGGTRLKVADLLSTNEASVRALDEFCDRREKMRLEGAAYVCYQREAYVSRAAESLRVTFDRQIVGQTYHSDCSLALPEQKAVIEPKGVVLELKYNGRIPHWMHDLVGSFRLDRTPFSKYVYCTDALRNVAMKASLRVRSA